MMETLEEKRKKQPGLRLSYYSKADLTNREKKWTSGLGGESMGHSHDKRSSDRLKPVIGNWLVYMEVREKVGSKLDSVFK